MHKYDKPQSDSGSLPLLTRYVNSTIYLHKNYASNIMLYFCHVMKLQCLKLTIPFCELLNRYILNTYTGPEFQSRKGHAQS